MSWYCLSHLSDETLLGRLAQLVIKDRHITAALLAHLAEVDARKLYLPAGYPSMHAYCVGELRLSEDAANKRIRLARKAREVPAIFAAIGDGRLHLSGAALLASYLTLENSEELIAAAAGKTRFGIEEMLASHFPSTGTLPMVERLPAESLCWVPAEMGEPAAVTEVARNQPAPGPVRSARRACVAPIAHGRFVIPLTIDQAMYDKLNRVQALLSHKIPNGDLVAIFDRMLDLTIVQLEKKKLGAASNPRPLKRSSSSRYIPAQVRRAVWSRDEGQCTFVSEKGRRCTAHRLLEFDHVIPVARGGESTAPNLRLRCRAHNQYEAEREFGRDFVRRKREQAKAEQTARAKAKARADELIPGLRQLGFSVDESRRAATFCESMSDASLEGRFRAALSYLRPRSVTRGAGAAAP